MLTVSATAKTTRQNAPRNGPSSASRNSRATITGSPPNAPHPHAPSTIASRPWTAPSASTRAIRDRNAGSTSPSRCGANHASAAVYGAAQVTIAHGYGLSSSR